MPRRWLSIFAIGAVLVHAVPACMNSDDELNPQPLPPGEPPDFEMPSDQGSGAAPPAAGTGGDAASSADGASESDAGNDAANDADGDG